MKFSVACALLATSVAATPAPRTSDANNGFMRIVNRLNAPWPQRIVQGPTEEMPTQTISGGNMRINRFLNGTIFKKVRYGPFKVPSKDTWDLTTLITGEKGSVSKLVNIEPFCKDCFVLQSQTYLEYADGREASATTGVYNHHAIYINPQGESQLMVCKGTGDKFNRGPKLVGGAAIDGSYSLYTTPDGQFKSGNYISKDATLKLQAEFINYKTEPQEIYVTTDLEAVQGPRSDYMNAVTLPLSAVPCLEAQFVLKKEIDARTSQAYTAPEDGFIINVTGHMHDGGDKVTLTLNDKQVCTAKALYDAKSVTTGSAHHGTMGDSMSGMTKCQSVIEVKKGDKMTVSAAFNATAHPMRVNNNGKPETVMGLSVVTFAYALGTSFVL